MQFPETCISEPASLFLGLLPLPQLLISPQGFFPIISIPICQPFLDPSSLHTKSGEFIRSFLLRIITKRRDIPLTPRKVVINSGSFELPFTPCIITVLLKCLSKLFSEVCQVDIWILLKCSSFKSWVLQVGTSRGIEVYAITFKEDSQGGTGTFFDGIYRHPGQLIDLINTHLTTCARGATD